MFIKICGTTSEEDALLAVGLGADAVGFIFATSPRQVAPQLAADVVKRLPPEIVTVGVFRDHAPARVVDIVHAAGLRVAQLHGHETAEDARWIGARVPLVIKAFAAGDARVARANDYASWAVLLDAPNPGSGQVFDWAFASEVPTGQRLIIAGGLTPSNVGAAIARTLPWGVDVVSGVERSPGKKDPVKLREFIAAARAAEPGEYVPSSEEAAPYDWQEE
jgi:phosphoribosylanthranilate isomerase